MHVNCASLAIRHFMAETCFCEILAVCSSLPRKLTLDMVYQLRFVL